MVVRMMQSCRWFRVLMDIFGGAKIDVLERRKEATK